MLKRSIISAALALLLLVSGLPVLAMSVDAPLPDPAQEMRARAVSKEIRCLVCQNQSIEDSNAPLASDLRVIVRERIAAGDTDQQVRDYLVKRYGDWVLLNPPFNIRTLLLWFLPALLFALAAGGALLFFRRRQREAATEAPVALSEQEKARMAALLKGDDGARQGS